MIRESLSSWSMLKTIFTFDSWTAFSFAMRRRSFRSFLSWPSSDDNRASSCSMWSSLVTGIDRSALAAPDAISLLKSAVWIASPSDAPSISSESTSLLDAGTEYEWSSKVEWGLLLEVASSRHEGLLFLVTSWAAGFWPACLLVCEGTALAQHPGASAANHQPSSSHTDARQSEPAIEKSNF